MTRSVTAPSGHQILVDEDLGLPGSVSIGSHGYAQVWVPPFMLLHRWILGLEVGDERYADHINGDPLDNRRANLRVVDGTESNLNRRVKGRCVYPVRDRWQAKVGHRGHRHYLGTYDTYEEAEAVVEAFRQEHEIVHQRF